MLSDRHWQLQDDFIWKSSNDSVADGPSLKLWMYGRIRAHGHPEFLWGFDFRTLFILRWTNVPCIAAVFWLHCWHLKQSVECKKTHAEDVAMWEAKIIPSTSQDLRKRHILNTTLYRHCWMIKISSGPVKFEIYDRPRALSRKLAKSLGCPGKKGWRTDRSMVLSVSVSVLEENEEVQHFWIPNFAYI